VFWFDFIDFALS